MRQPVVKPLHDTKPNLEIVQGLAKRLQLILGGPFTLAFWLLFFSLGLLLPLLMEIWEVVSARLPGTIGYHGKWIAASTAILVLAGGFLLRYIFVYAGQISAFR
jgi:protein NrfD